ncbi:ABC-2 transporter permease [Adlercreutzia sp. R21]|uniref:ABC-2 transporter permease n=1 Tax=Adlercreutzia wanghongyangiae TaxID=3111451 RepID=A0ABU6IK37_9ACTN|nr:ABC-2 transporter permease [Adlercreutzia sp. R21]MEC4176755.1 ABC-2 transporter permease [Adlercreutzia sp. R7]MEC4184679.1 ABC-2 transporter permease [Adlercreutzia sp. R21]
MKTMIVADFCTLRNALLQLMAICVVIALFMGYAMGTLIGMAAAIAAMPPFMLLFSLAATDEQNSWERFRLTLPLTRRQVVFGRYASLGLIAIGTIVFALALSFLLLGIISFVPSGILPEGLTPAENPPAALVGSVVGAVGVITLGMAIALPLVFRFGMTRATRFVPVIVVIALAAGIGFFDANISFTSGGFFSNLMLWLDTGNNYLFLAAALVAVVALVYGASALIATKLYEKREF